MGVMSATPFSAVQGGAVAARLPQSLRRSSTQCLRDDSILGLRGPCLSCTQLSSASPNPILRLQCLRGSLTPAGANSLSNRSSLFAGRRRKSRTRGIVCAAEEIGATTADGKLKSRREVLLEYVKTVQPEFMDRFVKHSPEIVVDAMRQTVTNMLGTLPPQFFQVTITTVGENLAQLMYSVLMTGYMFRNAFYRLELSQVLVSALPDPARPRRADPEYEAGVQLTHVGGHVLRWHKERGAEPLPAVDYIAMLESEVQQLEGQLEQARSLQAKSDNKLLNLLKTLEPRNLQELTSSAGEDALEAMHAFIQRLLGVSDTAELKTASSDTTSTELAKLLYWLMVVGYSIRNLEVRFDMERALGASVKLGELPAGEL